MCSCLLSGFFSLLLFTLSAIVSSNSGSYSDSYSDSYSGSGSGFVLYGKSVGLIYLSSNSLIHCFGLY